MSSKIFGFNKSEMERWRAGLLKVYSHHPVTPLPHYSFWDFKKLMFLVILCLIQACDGGRQVPVFDGNKAYEYLKKQCGFGARIPGSIAHQQCRHWHTTQDTPDKCSPESLQQVGQLILSIIYDK